MCVEPILISVLTKIVMMFVGNKKVFCECGALLSINEANIDYIIYRFAAPADFILP